MNWILGSAICDLFTSRISLWPPPQVDLQVLPPFSLQFRQNIMYASTLLKLLYLLLLPLAVAAAPSHQAAITNLTPSTNPGFTSKVPGTSPAYHCSDSDPTTHIFQIYRLDFVPTTPRMYGPSILHTTLCSKIN